MAQTPRTILCFGDSNTHGTVPMAHLDDARRFGPDARWPSVLARLAGPGFHIVEEGLPGRTTVHPDPIEGEHLSGVLALPILLGTHTPIEAIVMMLGTNDLKPRFSVGAIDIALGLRRLVLAIRALSERPGRIQPAILLVAPPPIIETGCLAEIFARGEQKSQRFGEEIGAMAERLGTGFLDAGAHIAVSPLDGIHFEAEAQIGLGRAVHAALVPLLGEAPAGGGT